MSFNPGSALTPSHDDPLEDSVLPASPRRHPLGSRRHRHWNRRFEPGSLRQPARAPVRVETSLGVPRFDREGRFMAAHFQTARGRFVVVNGYFPKGSGPARDNSRVGYKLDFSRTVFARAQALRRRGRAGSARAETHE